MADFAEDLDFGISLANNDVEAQQKKNTTNPITTKEPYRPQNNLTSSSNDAVNEQNTIGKSDYDLSQAAHPSICIATFAFKASAILMYFPIGYIMSTILMFIFVLVLSAIDFWVVKNISGRLLVGLRWRSEYDENGKQVWRFESYDKDFVSNKVDKAFFWGSQALGTLIWGFFFIINVLGLNFFNATLLFICTSLCFTNLYGYYKCRGDHHKKIKDLKSKYGAKGLMTIAGKFM